jgi:hypothetical protein
MNLFGLEISLAKRNGNGEYMTKENCFLSQNQLKRHLDDCLRELKRDMNVRFDDLKDFFLDKRHGI